MICRLFGFGTRAEGVDISQWFNYGSNLPCRKVVSSKHSTIQRREPNVPWHSWTVIIADFFVVLILMGVFSVTPIYLELANRVADVSPITHSEAINVRRPTKQPTYLNERLSEILHCSPSSTSLSQLQGDTLFDPAVNSVRSNTTSVMPL